jgi:glycosyltransferase involved in cell wall biosynthesis
MINNNIIVIVPFRNVVDFIGHCSWTLINQKYQNWRAIFCDDASTDNSVDYIYSDSRLSIKTNKERITALPNIHNAVLSSNLDDNDIVCVLDGDDMLSTYDTLDIINSMYQDDTLLTYGQYIRSDGVLGHCTEYTEYEFNHLRHFGFKASHMRTFKYLAYKEMMRQDPNLNCLKDIKGNYYTTSCDVALTTPLLEIAGFNRVKFNPTPIYYYRLHNNNDHVIDPLLQNQIAEEIFRKPKFQTLC